MRQYELTVVYPTEDELFRAGKDAVAARPQPPAQVHILEVGEVIGIESPSVQEEVSPDDLGQPVRGQGRQPGGFRVACPQGIVFRGTRSLPAPLFRPRRDCPD